MKIETVAEHSFCPDLLPENAKVLDLGCRGFLFTDEMRRRGYNVLAVDIDKFDRDDYFQIAISNEVGRVGIKRSPDPQATMIGEGSEVICMDLKMLMLTTQVEFFDLIKMDIEGSEYEVIMSLTKPPAKQLSIEFHLHTGIYTDHDVKVMYNKLNHLGYVAIQHYKYSMHGCGGNFWDSLFILQ